MIISSRIVSSHIVLIKHSKLTLVQSEVEQGQVDIHCMALFIMLGQGEEVNILWLILYNGLQFFTRYQPFKL